MKLTSGNYGDDHGRERVRSRMKEHFGSTYLRSPYKWESKEPWVISVRIRREVFFSYLEYDQRAIPQIAPQLLISLLHIPVRIRRSPELR